MKTHKQRNARRKARWAKNIRKRFGKFDKISHPCSRDRRRFYVWYEEKSGSYLVAPPGAVKTTTSNKHEATIFSNMVATYDAIRHYKTGNGAWKIIRIKRFDDLPDH